MRLTDKTVLKLFVSEKFLNSLTNHQKEPEYTSPVSIFCVKQIIKKRELKHELKETQIIEVCPFFFFHILSYSFFFTLFLSFMFAE